MMKKERLDKHLVDLGFFDSREKAKKAIMAGMVEIDGQCRTKAGDQVQADLQAAAITVKGDPVPYVSRGGLKLEKGLAVFDFPVEGTDLPGHRRLPPGALPTACSRTGRGGSSRWTWATASSTGACATIPGWSAWSGPISGILTLEQIGGEPVDGTVMDVSFISIVKMLPVIHGLTRDGGMGIWLIKPQFEAGREAVGKHGVVRDPAIHQRVIEQTVQAIAAQGFDLLGLDYSPVRGPKGNIEFLCWTRKGAGTEPPAMTVDEKAIAALVARAHEELCGEHGNE